MLQLHKSIGKDTANFNQLCKQKLWIDVFLAFMDENKNEALDQADGLECFCNEDTDGSNEDNDGSDEDNDGRNDDTLTLILGSAWLNQQVPDVAVLSDVEDEEQFMFFCEGDDSSEPEWIDNEESNFYQKYLIQLE